MYFSCTKFYTSTVYEVVNFLQGFSKLQEMIFKQLNEKMRAMDRSLLEKVAADIEMLDQDQGILDSNNLKSIFGIFSMRLSINYF